MTASYLLLEKLVKNCNRLGTLNLHSPKAQSWSNLLKCATDGCHRLFGLAADILLDQQYLRGP
jgi:hypothetical protein